jgi:cytochrome c
MPRQILFALPLVLIAVDAFAATPSGDAKRGEQFFRACAACHSLAPNKNMTGPSLAGIWGRKAGTLETFERYSPALKASSTVWDATTLDPWLKAPAQFIPKNRMTFDGVSNAATRADLIAFLKEVGAGRAKTAESANSGPAAEFPDLKKMGPESQVQAIRYCRDTYHVTTADGETDDFWETNLRLKTDSSEKGPLAGKPVILPAGMQGDRASVFFAAPEEISAFIKHQC